MLGVGENADREILGIDPRMRTATADTATYCHIRSRSIPLTDMPNTGLGDRELVLLQTGNDIHNSNRRIISIISAYGGIGFLGTIKGNKRQLEFNPIERNNSADAN